MTQQRNVYYTIMLVLHVNSMEIGNGPVTTLEDITVKDTHTSTPWSLEREDCHAESSIAAMSVCFHLEMTL